MNTATIQIFSTAIEIGERTEIFHKLLSRKHNGSSHPLQLTEQLFGTRAHVFNRHENIRTIVPILLFKLRDENVGGRNLVYNDPYDFEDGVTASE
jgi:hypothetical protein